MIKTVAGAMAIAMFSAAGAPALAIHNPIVLTIHPVGRDGAHGHVTLFQLGRNVDVSVILGRDRKGTQSVGIDKGTCAKYDPRPEWVVVGVAGTTQDTRLSNLPLRRLLGYAVVIHKAKSRSSPAIGCAQIEDRG